MPRKKKQTKNLEFTFDPASPPGAEGQALLDALRSNLSLLGEIAMRYEVNNKPERPEDPPSIGSPRDIHSLLGPEMSSLAQEQLRVLLLDTHNNVIGQRVVYQGNVSSSIVRAAEVFRPAVVEAVPAIAIAHNHPSGSADPSPEDVLITRKLKQAADLLDIELVDHVVIGQGAVRQPQGERADGRIEAAASPHRETNRQVRNP